MAIGCIFCSDAYQLSLTFYSLPRLSLRQKETLRDHYHLSSSQPLVQCNVSFALNFIMILLNPKGKIKSQDTLSNTC